MLVLGLLICVVLRALSTHATVVQSFSGCNPFFYKGTEPRGMDQNARNICQELEHGGFYYASLYSVHHKIPLYSAYTLDQECRSATGRTDNWHVEPQLMSNNNLPGHMVLEKDLRNLGYNVDDIKRSQAMSSDYTDTGYDRGHLNPSSFQCNDGRTATFTLTNAVPMDACFNRIHWKNWESTLRSFLLSKLDSGAAYIVTGTVPAANLRIPQKEISEDPERVTVPSHIWTAVCYKHLWDDDESFSFSYMGENQPEGGIRLMSVSDLNDELQNLYGTSNIQIFVDDCFGFNNKLDEINDRFNKLIRLSVNQGVQMSTGMQNTYLAVKRTVGSDNIVSKKRVKVSEMIVKLAFSSMEMFYRVVEDLKAFAGSACVITQAKPVRPVVNDELRKRELSEGTDVVECLLVPEKQKTTADGSPCLGHSEHLYGCNCDSGKKCCSSPCLYKDKLDSYWCFSGSSEIECSPRYSLVTLKGERCLDDYPCGTYGEKYYWCRTSFSYIKGYKWDYCSPPLWKGKTVNGELCRSNHACAKYGKSYTWCYTDDNNNWDYCCTSGDCSKTPAY